jgi:hypothetical protein
MSFSCHVCHESLNPYTTGVLYLVGFFFCKKCAGTHHQKKSILQGLARAGVIVHRWGRVLKAGGEPPYRILKVKRFFPPLKKSVPGRLV